MAHKGSNSGGNSSSGSGSDRPDIEIGPVRDAETGEIVDADPTEG